MVFQCQSDKNSKPCCLNLGQEQMVKSGSLFLVIFSVRDWTPTAVNLLSNLFQTSFINIKNRKRQTTTTMVFIKKEIFRIFILNKFDSVVNVFKTPPIDIQTNEWKTFKPFIIGLCKNSLKCFFLKYAFVKRILSDETSLSG